MTHLGKTAGAMREEEVRAKVESALAALEMQWLEAPPADGKKPSLQKIYELAGIGPNTLNTKKWETLLDEVKLRKKGLGVPPGTEDDPDDPRTPDEKSAGKRLSVAERLARWRKVATDLRQRNIETELELIQLNAALEGQRLKVADLEKSEQSLRLDIIELSKRLASALGTNVVTLRAGDPR